MRQRLAATAIAVLALATLTTGVVRASSDGPTSVRTVDEDVTVPGGPTSPGDVRLRTTLYLPSGKGRHPAVIVSPGFGQTKDAVARNARDLARHGFVALAWTMRGFNPLAVDGGRIALDAPDTEVADLSRLIDRLATRPDVLLDGPGDPRVGLSGQSYGGGISLMGAAYDHRVDAIVPVITWNSLASSLLPGGVFKAQYASVFFAGAASGGCVRFAQRVCDAYTHIAQTGTASAADLALLRWSSPPTDRIAAPTLLIQGEDDTLFPLSESLRTATALQARGVPVHLAWVKGGHDSPFGTKGDARIRAMTATWFERWLGKDTSVRTGPVFRWDRSAGDGGSARSLPPLDAPGTVPLQSGGSRTVSN
ncbi:MAG: CocE/NonD family hydrolase, partial [Mycobacteriales bacterium]